jgi:hypothetical protein
MMGPPRLLCPKAKLAGHVSERSAEVSRGVVILGDHPAAPRRQDGAVHGVDTTVLKMCSLHSSHRCLLAIAESYRSFILNTIDLRMRIRL